MNTITVVSFTIENYRSNLFMVLSKKKSLLAVSNILFSSGSYGNRVEKL